MAINSTNISNEILRSSTTQVRYDPVIPQAPVVEDRVGVLDALTQQKKATAAMEAEAEYHAMIASKPESYVSGSNKIKLVSTAQYPSTETTSLNAGPETVTFEISPEVSESNNAIYTEISAIRSAGSILIYTGSPSRKWQINSKFVSRTPNEAASTWRSIQLLKSWTKPDVNYKFGNDVKRMPHVVRLYGYGKTWMGIPVVVSSLNVEYPTDVDYVMAQEGTGPNSIQHGTLVPIVQTVSIQLTESRNIDELWYRFDLEKFKRGMMEGW